MSPLVKTINLMTACTLRTSVRHSYNLSEQTLLVKRKNWVTQYYVPIWGIFKHNWIIFISHSFLFLGFLGSLSLFAILDNLTQTHDSKLSQSSLRVNLRKPQTHHAFFKLLLQIALLSAKVSVFKNSSVRKGEFRSRWIKNFTVNNKTAPKKKVF